MTIAVEDNDVFNWTQAAGFVAEFCSLGGKMTKRIWIPPGTQDYSATVAQIPRRGVDGVVMVTWPDAAVGVARGYPALRTNLSAKDDRQRPRLSRDSRTWGRGRSGSSPAAESGCRTDRYVARMRRAFPKLNRVLLGSAFDVYYHDAMTATLQALDKVGGDLSGGGRRFQAALARVELDSSQQGHVRLDSTHQGIAPNYLLQLTRRASTVLRTIPGVERTFGGYFTSTDQRRAKSTPACVKRTPPPWAR